MEESLKSKKSSCSKNHVNVSMAVNDLIYDTVENEVKKVNEEMGINLSRNMIVTLHTVFRDDSFVVKSDDFVKSIGFVKTVYFSLNGDLEGLEDFVNSRKCLAYSSYCRLRVRLAIFSHFGFLKEVFFNKTDLLISKTFDDVTTFDIYRILSNNKFNSLEEFISYVNELSHTDKESLQNIPVSSEDVKILDEELMANLNSLKKKNAFIKMMSKHK